MTARIRALLLLYSLTALAGHAQLYLLTASPTSHDNEETPWYPSSILRPNAKGGVTEVRQIASSVNWVGVSYDERKAVIITDPQHGFPNVLVVDFNKADVVKNCEWPREVGASIIANWLAVQPGKGLSLEWVVSEPEVKDDSVAAILLDPSVPCEKSIWRPRSEDVRYVVAHGAAGMGGGVSQDTQIYGGSKDGSVFAFVGHAIPLGYRIPASLMKGVLDSRLLSNNQNVFSVSLGSKIGFFRKSDETWHEWQVPSQFPSLPRGFGRYLVAAEMRLSGPPVPNNAGEPEWRHEDSDRGPRTDAVPNSDKLTGRLLIYDTTTEKEFSITTNQGDSEVLLIENGTVYYRAATRLYSAPIAKDGIGPAHKLATSELIRDAHWAFIRH
jgi:hypothetical protein